MLKAGRQVIVLTQFFLPECLPDQFMQMYKGISENLKGEEAQSVVSCFHVKIWYENSRPSLEDLKLFAVINLDAIAKTSLDNEALSSHLVIFTDLLSLDKALLLPYAMNCILDRLVTSTISPGIIK